VRLRLRLAGGTRERTGPGSAHHQPIAAIPLVRGRRAGGDGAGGSLARAAGRSRLVRTGIRGGVGAWGTVVAAPQQQQHKSTGRKSEGVPLTRGPRHTTLVSCLPGTGTGSHSRPRLLKPCTS